MPNSDIDDEASSSRDVVDVPLGFLCKFVTQFSGDPRTLAPFLRNCQNAMDLASDIQKAILFNYIKSMIRGRAEIALNNREFDTFEELKKHFTEFYSDKKSVAQLQMELQSCRQFPNEGMAEFTQRVESCVTQLLQRTTELHSIECDGTRAESQSELKGKLSVVEQMGVTAFVLGSLPQYGLILRSRDPKTIREASQIALNEEKVSNYLSFSKSSHSNACSFCNGKGHSAAQCYKRDSSRTNSESTAPIRKSGNNINLANPPNSKGNFDPVRQPVVCNYCRKVGHLLADCRKRKWHNENKHKYNNSNQNTNHNTNHLTGSGNPPVEEKDNYINMADLNVNCAPISAPLVAQRKEVAELFIPF